MEALFLDQLVCGVRGVLTKLDGPSPMCEASEVSQSKPGMAVAWEARGFNEAERGQWLLGVLFPFYLAYIVFLGEAKLARVVVFSLPALGGRNDGATWWTPAMETMAGAPCRRWHSRAPVAR